MNTRIKRPDLKWPHIQAYYDRGHSIKECAEKFNFCTDTWYHALRRGEVKSRPLGKPLVSYLIKNCHSVCRHGIKKRLIREGLLKNECYECGAGPIWRGKPLVLVFDHINGVKTDYRLENLRLLCPNCNSQTETFSARNRVFQRRTA